ncbi:hypothetical protein ACHAXM_006577 [Skeletonema potamos]|jgi:hypothetical protein
MLQLRCRCTSIFDRTGSTGNPPSDVSEAEKKRSHEAETSVLVERAKKKPRLQETGRARPIAIERVCSACMILKTKEHFSMTQWKAAGKALKMENARCV